MAGEGLPVQLAARVLRTSESGYYRWKKHTASARSLRHAFLTEIDRDFHGDARFPGWTRGDFVAVSRERQRAAAPNDFDFSFVTLRRVTPG